MSAPHYLKWAGGKRRLATHISEHFGGPCTGTYFEPFFGSGAVFLERAAAGEIRGHARLSDINAALMILHRAIRDDPDAVLADLQNFPKEEGSWEGLYYEHRTAFNEMKEEIDRGPPLGAWLHIHGPYFAALFLWINRACFNGLYRENKKGIFNVPVGRYKRLSIPSDEILIRASDLLGAHNLKDTPFHVPLEEAGDGDQVYCDPPYVPISDTASFIAYSKNGFDWGAHQQLAELAGAAADRGATVILSNADVPEVRDLYTDHGFTLHTVQARRSVGAKVRGKVLEILAVKGTRPDLCEGHSDPAGASS